MKSLSGTLSLMQTLEMRYQANFSGVHEHDLITQDLLHKLELEQNNAVQLVQLAKQLKECRQTRRLMKDEIDRIQPLMDFMQDDQNKKAIHQLSAALGRMRTVADIQSKRVYHPRVLTGNTK